MDLKYGKELANNKKVFEPWQGRNIILTDAKNTGVYDIVFDSDKRFSLGTSILTNRDFWETLTLNKQLTVSQFISPEKNNLYAVILDSSPSLGVFNLN